ncbi:MAG: hypothetical protein ABIQ60_01540, partial [Burkholderiaceae bacterium]
MLTARIQLLEFMDSTPFTDCEVSLTARVLAGWEKRIVVGGPDGIPRGPRPSGPPETVVVVDFDEARAISLQGQARTNAQGRADIALDLSAAFAQARALRRNGAAPVAVV